MIIKLILLTLTLIFFCLYVRERIKNHTIKLLLEEKISNSLEYKEIEQSVEKAVNKYLK